MTLPNYNPLDAIVTSLFMDNCNKLGLTIGELRLIQEDKEMDKWLKSRGWIKEGKTWWPPKK